MKKNKTLIVGWDAADWKVIEPLMKEGRMPALQKLMDEGVFGNLVTLDPPLSPMLWTSIATGKRAYDHGILGFVEPHESGNDLRPVFSTSRKVKAFWNIFNQEGYKSNVIAWWPSHPVEPINGIMISNLFQQTYDDFKDSWPAPKNAVHPPEQLEHMAALRVHPNEITYAHLLPFVPGITKYLSEIDKYPTHKKSIELIEKFIAHCATVQSTATEAMAITDWDLTAVYFDAIDHFSHAFMRYYPPRQEHITEEDYMLYNEVVKGAYVFHDMMLERLIALAGDDTNIIVLSDHGFHSDHQRLKRIPAEPSGPAAEHRPYGILCMKGPNIKKGERIYGASLLDITPTLLTLNGLPVGADMEGRVLTQIFEHVPEIKKIESWEKVDGNAGRHPEEMQVDAFAMKQAMDQLAELGYIDNAEESMAEKINNTLDENQYNLARSYMDGKKNTLAYPILKDLVSRRPSETRFAVSQMNLLLEEKKFEECKALVTEYRPRKNIKQSYLDYIEGCIQMNTHRPRLAIELFEKANAGDQPSSTILYLTGTALLKIHEWDRAITSFNKALDLNKDNPLAWHGLGIALYEKESYEDALEAFFNATDLFYFLNQAHYYIGMTFYKMGDFANAEKAFKVAVTQAPGMSKAHQMLVNIYKRHMPEKTKERDYHQKFMEKNIKGTITIVSGLPRSGTSLMMQILDKGGMEILTDSKRIADDSNPKGYYEFEKVKSLAKDKSWLPEANGKAVKIIAQLIPHLTEEFNYRIIFMERDLGEVLKSQQKMLGKPADAYPFALGEVFKKNVAQVKKLMEESPNMDVLYVNYSNLVNNPQEEIERVNSFLGNLLNGQNSMEAVDKNLYRNRL